MVDRERDLSGVLSRVEQEVSGAPTPAPTRQHTVQDFAPQKYRQAGDSLEQIQQDFRKGLAELEQRYKALFDELKRITG